MALFEEVFAPYVRFGGRRLELAAPRLHGTDVALLQAMYNLMLAAMTPPQGPMGKLIAISGVYDEATEAAVRGIQAYFGLAADGVVGEETYFVFGQSERPKAGYGGPPYGSRSLRVGSSGGDVKVLQNRLNLFRYQDDVGRSADGYFSARTAAAVAAMKGDACARGYAGLDPNAIAGDGYYDASWLYTLGGSREIFAGRNGFDVAMTQVLLREIGLYLGPVTGYYDTRTEDAVRSLQAATGLQVDGVLGADTFYALGRRNLRPAPSPLGVPWPVTVALRPAEGSVATGRALLYYRGSRLTADVTVIGLIPGKAYRCQIRFGDCEAGGRPGLQVASFVADPSGSAWIAAEFEAVHMVPTSGWVVAVSELVTDRQEDAGILCCGDVAPAFPVLSPAAEPLEGPVDIRLSPRDGMAAKGLAVLRFITARALQVTLTVSELQPGSRHPAHIHYGRSGAGSAGAIAYPLTDVVADSAGVGRSITVVQRVTAIPQEGWHLDLHLGPSLAGGGDRTIASGDLHLAQPVLPGRGI